MTILRTVKKESNMKRYVPKKMRWALWTALAGGAVLATVVVAGAGMADRDKSGTSGVPEKGEASQVPCLKGFARPLSSLAERQGFEPWEGVITPSTV
jgi:hypothetical protein